MANNIKPKIPQKPSYLINGDGQENKAYHRTLAPRIENWERRLLNSTALTSDSAKTDDNDVGNIVITNSNENHSPLQSNADVENQVKLHPTSNQSGSSRESCCFDGYVEINFPCVQPGTCIRCDEKTGELREIPRKAQQHTISPEGVDENKLVPQSISDGSTKTGLTCTPDASHVAVRNLRNSLNLSNSLDSLIPSSQQALVDENGYEIPIAFQRPTYISFDSDFVISSADETDASERMGKTTVVSERKKKRRLAKYKRNVDQSLKPSSLVDNLSKSFTLRCPAAEQNENSTCNQEEIIVIGKPLVKPIDSFLSNRLRAVQSETDLVHKYATQTSNEWATLTALSGSSSEDEWSSSSECSSDEGEECYYHQIDPPEFASDVEDHDYEVIEEFSDWADESKKVSRKKSMKSVMASVVNGRKRDKRLKPGDLNKSPTDLGKSPKLQRKNMQDMRTTSVQDCTWATVSTPGILRLDDFKDIGKNKTSSLAATAAY